MTQSASQERVAFTKGGSGSTKNLPIASDEITEGDQQQLKRKDRASSHHTVIGAPNEPAEAIVYNKPPLSAGGNTVNLATKKQIPNVTKGDNSRQILSHETPTSVSKKEKVQHLPTLMEDEDIVLESRRQMNAKQINKIP